MHKSASKPTVPSPALSLAAGTPTLLPHFLLFPSFQGKDCKQPATKPWNQVAENLLISYCHVVAEACNNIYYLQKISSSLNNLFLYGNEQKRSFMRVMTCSLLKDNSNPGVMILLLLNPRLPWIWQINIVIESMLETNYVFHLQYTHVTLLGTVSIFPFLTKLFINNKIKKKHWQKPSLNQTSWITKEQKNSEV